jgi:hypothetical protein
MSALLEHSPLFADAPDDEGRPAPEHASARGGSQPAHGGSQPARTLDDVIAGAWETLRGGAATTCPVCGGELAPRYSAGAGVVGGRCGGCGSTLG